MGGDFKKQTEIGNDNLPFLAVEGFFHVPWMKHERHRVLFYLTLIETANYFG